MLVCLRAVQRTGLRDFALAGVLLSCTTLGAAGLRAVAVLPRDRGADSRAAANARRARSCGWAALALAAALTMVPWFTYNYVNLGQFTLSPAGGIGRGLWEGIVAGPMGRPHRRRS